LASTTSPLSKYVMFVTIQVVLVCEQLTFSLSMKQISNSVYSFHSKYKGKAKYLC
jgi:hypothetical protein